MRLARAFVMAALVFVVCDMAAGSDWPQWQGPNRDSKSGETGLLKQWPKSGPKLLWSAKRLGIGYSQAVVVDGTVYVTGSIKGKGYCHAFDLDGTPKWKKTYGPVWTGGRPGARTTPTIRDGRLYVITTPGLVSCFDAKTGKTIWQVDLKKKFGAKTVGWGNTESLLIDGDNVICRPGGNKVMMAALNRKTRETVWTTTGLPGTSSYCSPMLVERGGTRLIATMTSRHIVGVDADSGKVLWKRAYKNKWAIHPVTPVYADGMFYFTSGYNYGGVMLELSADGKKFTERWTEKKPDPCHGGVVLLDGYIYASASSRGGKWYCVELKTGKVVWEAKIVRNGSSILADGLFYCYGDDSRVALVQMSPKGRKVISKFKITKGGGDHWARLAISDGRLYVRHGDALIVYDIKDPKATAK